MANAEREVPSVWLLGVASGLSPFGMAIVVPALGSVSERFSADFLSVQFLVSAYLLGLSIAQPACGFLCDRYGRRPIMLVGFLVFVAASLLCAVAPTLELLIAARFVQAAGVSVGTVASRAILRDTRSADKVAEGMSYIAATMGLAPVVAPIAGGVLDSATGYAWIFVFSAAMGLLVLVNMLMHLSETLPQGTPQPRWRDWLVSYGELLRSKKFVGSTLVFGFVQGTFFSFMAIGAAHFATAFGYSSSRFGTIWGLMALAYVLGAWIGARTTRAYGTRRVVSVSVLLAVAGGAVLALLNVLGESSPTTILLPLGFLMTLSGSITPGAMAGAIQAHPVIAGTASGLSSAIGLLVGGLFTILAGAVYTGAFGPIALLILGTCLATAASWWLAEQEPLSAPMPQK